MTNWLAKASGAISRETEELPQEFQLNCECGQSHQGHRRSKPQRIICQTCGAALFILPRNVYPTLEPPKRKRRRRSGSSSRRGEFASLATFSRGVGRGTATAGRFVGHAAGSAVRSVAGRIGNAGSRVLGFLHAQMTPFRLVIAGITVMLMVTGLFAVHSRNLEKARQVLRAEFDAGSDSLQEDDAATAREHFEKAAAAADRLGSTDARSQRARQLLHETTAMTHLAPASLLEMLEEAEGIVSGQHPERWDDRFRVTYAGTWVVLEAPIHRPVDPSEPGEPSSADSRDSSSVVIDLPLVVGDASRPVHVTATVPSAFVPSLSAESQPAIFAAAITGCRLGPSGEQWQVTLDSGSGFFWSDIDNLRRLGFMESDWVSEDEVQQLLDVQSRSRGSE